MIHSMTGYARAETETELGTLSVELRAVNHRYLELAFRMPEDLRQFETACREQIQSALSRGKVDCNMRFKAAIPVTAEVEVNEALAKSLLAACESLHGLMQNPARMTPMDILGWPGVIKESATDFSPLGGQLSQTLATALTQLKEMRSQEGARIKQMVDTRLSEIAEIAKAVRLRLPQVLAATREKLNTRLAELKVEADPQRLEQELVLLAQKMDVAEELDRLESHIAAVGQAFSKKEPVGRRLDFLMQEFNREANTLGSKSADVETTQAAVTLKVLIEQMREQVQNIE